MEFAHNDYDIFFCCCCFADAIFVFFFFHCLSSRRFILISISLSKRWRKKINFNWNEGNFQCFSFELYTQFLILQTIEIRYFLPWNSKQTQLRELLLFFLSNIWEALSIFQAQFILTCTTYCSGSMISNLYSS